MTRTAPLLLLACAACGAGVHRAGTPAATPPSTVAARPSTDLASKIDAIFADYAKPDAPGCAVGVYRAGDIVFARGYGVANLEDGVKIDKDTVFDVGSISKQFTAAAIALLVLDGKISLDDDVRKYVPELPDFGRPIRLHHLLHHTSGLRDVGEMLWIGGFDGTGVTNDDDMLFALRHQKALSFPTGTEWSYSNAGYFLLSLVVKRVTGTTLAEVARTRIFEPLGMKSTLILDDHTRVIPHRAMAYAPRADGHGLGIEMVSSEHVGDGRVQTTVDDLARWDANFYSPAPSVGGARMVEMLRTPGRLDDGKPLTYALGLNETIEAGLLREEHDGSDAGYSADVLRYPTERLTVACLCNVAGTDPDKLAHSVAEAILPQLAPPTSPGAHADDVAAERTATAGGGMPATTIEAACGAYYAKATFAVRTLKQEGSAIILTLGLGPGAIRRELVPVDARTFAVKGQSARYVVDLEAKSLTRVLAHADDETFVRFVPVVVTPALLGEYTGRYTSDEFANDFQIAVVDGALELRIWGRSVGARPLTPVTPDLFSDENVVLKFERDAKHQVTGFALSAETFRDVKLTRR